MRVSANDAIVSANDAIFKSEHGFLPRSVLRTTNGFGFRASVCVVDFNVKWRRCVAGKKMNTIEFSGLYLYSNCSVLSRSLAKSGNQNYFQNGVQK